MTLSVAERLERVTWDLFWIPEESTVISRPELLAIATPGCDSHLNSVFRARPEAGREAELVSEVMALHADAKASRFLLADTVETTSLEGALAARDYRETYEHDMPAVSAAAFMPRTRGDFKVRAVCDSAGLRDSYVVSDAAFGVRDRLHSDAEELALYCGAESRSRFFVAYDGSEPVSAGAINENRELGVALLWGGGTVPAARGRGAYSAVLSARIAWAASRGIDVVGVFARTATSSPIVAAQGFERCGRLTYWERSAAKRSVQS